MPVSERLATTPNVDSFLRTASTQTALHWAPLKSSMQRDNSSKLTPLLQKTLQIEKYPRKNGNPVKFLLKIHFSCMNLQNSRSRLFRRHR